MYKKVCINKNVGIISVVVLVLLFLVVVLNTISSQKVTENTRASAPSSSTIAKNDKPHLLMMSATLYNTLKQQYELTPTPVPPSPACLQYGEFCLKTCTPPNVCKPMYKEDANNYKERTYCCPPSTTPIPHPLLFVSDDELMKLVQRLKIDLSKNRIVAFGTVAFPLPRPLLPTDIVINAEGGEAVLDLTGHAIGVSIPTAAIPAAVPAAVPAVIIGTILSDIGVIQDTVETPPSVLINGKYYTITDSQAAISRADGMVQAIQAGGKVLVQIKTAVDQAVRPGVNQEQVEGKPIAMAQVYEIDSNQNPTSYSFKYNDPDKDPCNKPGAYQQGHGIDQTKNIINIQELREKGLITESEFDAIFKRDSQMSTVLDNLMTTEDGQRKIIEMCNILWHRNTVYVPGMNVKWYTFDLISQFGSAKVVVDEEQNSHKLCQQWDITGLSAEAVGKIAKFFNDVRALFP